MPRKSRIDTPGALHHIMCRGIEGRKVFITNGDREHFLERLGKVLQETTTLCYAWALLPNHFHLLLRTGLVPISTVMRRLLTGYALWYNRAHHRRGHLFQNRFKSVLCQEDEYLLQLVRYIHLNPIRAGLVQSLDDLTRYPFSGHSVLMGKVKRSWQQTEEILPMFGERIGEARRRYLSFMQDGIAQGKRTDLTGGGLIRSAGGWEAVQALKKGGMFQKSDERILGDGDFVERVLRSAEETMEKRYALRSRGFDLEKAASRAAELVGLKEADIWAKGKHPRSVQARSLLCYWAVRELGETMSSIAGRLGISIPAVSKSITRGERLARTNGYSLLGS
jgi:REP element-mobilizing transposase RayT